jgi:hypothetical protein
MVCQPCLDIREVGCEGNDAFRKSFQLHLIGGISMSFPPVPRIFADSFCAILLFPSRNAGYAVREEKMNAARGKQSGMRFV